eukprot:8713344-Pyramimonas_sp.AAC.1
MQFGMTLERMRLVIIKLNRSELSSEDTQHRLLSLADPTRVLIVATDVVLICGSIWVRVPGSLFADDDSW